MTEAARDGQGCPICRALPLSMLAPFDRPGYKVIHCDACGYEAIRPLPTRAQLESVYSGFPVTMSSDAELRFLVDRSVAFLRYFLRKTGLRDARTADLKFLDVGFGNAAGLLAAAKVGFQAFGIEIDAASVTRSREKAAEYDLSVNSSATDIHDYRRDLRFDVVRSSNVIELVLDPRRFVADIAERQPAGGHLLIECQNNDGAFWRVKNHLRRRFGRMDHYNSLKIDELLSGFTKNSISILLRRAGYRVLRCRDYGIGDRMLDLEKIVWHPSVARGLRLALRHRWPHFFLKSLIPVFDRAASVLAGRGTCLSVWAQKL